MSVIKNGTPTIVQAGSQALGQAVSETTPNVISVTNVIGNAMAQFNDAAFMVYHPHTGKFYASSGASQRAGLSVAIVDPENLYLDPDDGQTGRSLAFSATAGNTLAGISITDLVTAVKPKFTVESLVARLLAKIQEREAASPAEAGKFFIVVDQVNKRVGIVKSDDEGGSIGDLDATVLSAGESVKMTLTPEAEESVSSPLPFEGGAV